MMVIISIVVAFAVSAVSIVRDPIVYVCESDGEIVSARDVREGQRIDDGCYVHRMKRSTVCSLAVCE